ncbi:chalcone isomerase family protein [Flammeovirga yaeyamensis]|uniref:Chalcone isomerase family protein n=1 Tax=Flammeovirga yaeyamensis TaxID=367791 RepID=A0AAX1N8D7_9BACT|nr:chalcone isomerase family protein [Flammeovirga yaeyamensis]MBB3700623.1 hypothetical protein [Flammeovirga yaeyamensis]NMF37739.1 hypothetical protein [Flammeovirga yaeyamensis]QWG02048.1 chalcone isomerase family protein [Flammeovirga yaeyamensis]
MKKLIILTLIIHYSSIVYGQSDHQLDALYNVKFNHQIEFDDQTFTLNGSGKHEIKIFKIFGCGLYLKNPSKENLDIIYSTDTRIIDFVISSAQFQSENTIKELIELHEKNKDLLKTGEFDELFKNIEDNEIFFPKRFTETKPFFEDAFNIANRGYEESYNNYIDDFIALFEKKNCKGDHYRIVFKGSNLTQIYKKGELVFKANDKAFQKAILNVFIGNDAFDKKLKKDLMGIKPLDDLNKNNL